MDDPTLQQQEVDCIRVLIADDHRLVRAGLRMILETEPDIEVAGEAEDGTRALEVALALRPDVVLADISMPPPDGIELTRLLRRDLPETRTLVVSMYQDEAMVRAALAAGAAGYVVKHAAPDELIQAIRTAVAGRRYLDPEMRERFLSSQ